MARLATEAGEAGLLAVALEGAARARADAEPEATAEMLGRAAWLRHRYDRPATGAEHAASEAATAAARAAIGDDAYTAAVGRGAAIGLDARRS